MINPCPECRQAMKPHEVICSRCQKITSICIRFGVKLPGSTSDPAHLHLIGLWRQKVRAY